MLKQFTQTRLQADPRNGADMPQDPHADRRARRATNALNWGLWLTAAMDADGVRPYELVEKAARLGGAIKGGHITHWRDGEQRAEAENAIVIARALDRDPVEALRAAGHDTIADEMESQAGREATTRREVAQQWSDWVFKRAHERGLTVDGLVDASDGHITRNDVADWTLAKRAATSPAAIRAAIILGADPYDALHASGHGRLAEQIQAINAAGRTNAAKSRATNGNPA